jgi:single-strand DNA-binding protein
MNTTAFIGRLGNDPAEIRLTKTGTPVTNFRVAVNNPVTDKATWIPVAAFGKLAEAAADHLAKGDEVAVTGELFTNEWVDDDGPHQVLQVIAHRLDFLRQKHTASSTDGELQAAS